MVSGPHDELLLKNSFKEPHYLLKTSGSQAQKAFVHSLSSMKASADSFFEQFAISKNDRWGVCLSTEHVAGFSILVRSYFGDLKEPYSFKWNVDTFGSDVEENNVTIASLVPTQVFDLVNKKVKAPKDFKFLFVGGAFISKELVDEAVELGWPLVVCYGSTETFAQMSFSSDGEFFKPYKGWEMRLSSSNEIELKGEGLYRAQVLESGKIQVREGEWFQTGDIGEVDGQWFSLKGKLNGLIKIKGSYFDFNFFKKEFSNFLVSKGLDSKKIFPVVLKEERNGAGLYLVTSLSLKTSEDLLLKYPQFRGVFKIEEENLFSSIGKLQKTKLEGVLSKQIVSL